MKKTTLLIVAVLSLGTFSCKKDRVCECTTTRTSSSGNVTTDPVDNRTYKEVSRREARTICQKSTQVFVSESGATSTVVYDCKLK